MKRDDKEIIIDDIERCRKIIFRINNPTAMNQNQPSINDYTTPILQIIETLQQALNINQFLELNTQQRQYIHSAELLLLPNDISSSSSLSNSNDLNNIRQQLIDINKKIDFICKYLNNDNFRERLFEHEYALRMEIIDIGVMQELHTQHQFEYWRFEYLANRIATAEIFIAEVLPLLSPHIIANMPIGMIPLAEVIYFPTIPIVKSTVQNNNVETPSEEEPTQAKPYETITQTLLQTIRGGFNRIYNIIRPPQTHPEETPLPQTTNELHIETDILRLDTSTNIETTTIIGCADWIH